jgi:hypothetical protein
MTRRGSHRNAVRVEDNVTIKRSFGIHLLQLVMLNAFPCFEYRPIDPYSNHPIYLHDNEYIECLTGRI